MLSDEYLEKKRADARAQNTGPDPMIWMITFSDLLLLMLTMFVMRLSMLTLDFGKHPSATPSGAITDAATTATGASRKTGSLPGPEGERPTDPAEAQKLTALTEGFYRIFGQQAPIATAQAGGRFGSEMDVSYHGGVLTASLLDGSFAAPGDELTFHANEAISTIVKTFGGGAFDLHISARSKLDKETEYFGSDWELSNARALAVLRQMLDAGVAPQCLKASSYGGPKAKSDAESTTENRVDIQISARKQ